MRLLARFGAFWLDFLVGDDWRLAAGTAIAIGATVGVADVRVPAWWLLPSAVAILLFLSLRRSVGSAPSSDGSCGDDSDA